jgi:phage gp37-like protein
MFAELENAVAGRMKAASDAEVLGYQIRAIDTYPADWDAYLGSKVLNYPAAWVTFGGLTDVDRVGFGSQVMAHFGVVVASKNLRNETFSRQGTPNVPNEPGSYQLALDVIALVNGSDLGLDWIEACSFHALKFVQSTPKMRELGISMMAVEFTTKFVLLPDNINLTDEFEGDLQTVDVKWDLPPFTTPKPADWVPDAEDTITIPQEEA